MQEFIANSQYQLQMPPWSNFCKWENGLEIWACCLDESGRFRPWGKWSSNSRHFQACSGHQYKSWNTNRKNAVGFSDHLDAKLRAMSNLPPLIRVFTKCVNRESISRSLSHSPAPSTVLHLGMVITVFCCRAFPTELVLYRPIYLTIINSHEPKPPKLWSWQPWAPSTINAAKLG